MALRLTVRRAAWEAHVGHVADAVDGLVPVVKGNGYGFGRSVLNAVAATLGDHVCVGTIHELDGIPPTVTAVVLTPTLTPPPSNDVVLTVGSVADVAALDGWRGQVVVKLQSSMRRYGATPSEVDAVFTAAAAAGLEVVGYALHLPLAGTDADRVAEVEQWLAGLDPAMPVWLSHLSPDSYAALGARHLDRTFRLRVGTALWHGDKSFMQLSADVIAVHPVCGGDRAGYRSTVLDDDGSVVLIGAGTAHGVGPLPNGDSPFHYRRRRLQLIEPPHMHTSMAFVATGTPCPAAADRIDVQRPLTATLVDEVEWV
jgi:alanine racemase